jgi:probable HAF family extracellular repeat protein
VGDTGSPAGLEAFRFTEDGGVELLGDLPGGTMTSTAWAVNADGSVIVGVGMNSTFQIEAFRWEAGAMTGLGINLGFLSSHALGVSADGAVIVGYQETASGTQHAFRWTQATGWAGLGGLTSPSSDSVARGVSADGAVIIGDALMQLWGDSSHSAGPRATGWWDWACCRTRSRAAPLRSAPTAR